VPRTVEPAARPTRSVVEKMTARNPKVFCKSDAPRLNELSRGKKVKAIADTKPATPTPIRGNLIF
jgi:hypothetical protein